MITNHRNSVVDFVLYSHVFISVCAVALASLTSLLYLGLISWNNELLFIFTSTMGLYGIHRIIGLQKAHDHLGENRFQSIKSFHWILILIITITLPVSGYLFLQFEESLQVFLIAPIVLSLAYVLPIWNKRRLRDVAYIKIFIISLVWAFVTIGIPMWDHLNSLSPIVVFLMIAERFLFILGITLPFDIRDLQVDKLLKVKTIPMQIGIVQSKRLSYFILLICTILMMFLTNHFLINFYTILGYIVGLMITGCLISNVTIRTSDYYFSGLMDGTMIILFTTTWIGHWVSMSLS